MTYLLYNYVANSHRLKGTKPVCPGTQDTLTKTKQYQYQCSWFCGKTSGPLLLMVLEIMTKHCRAHFF